MSYYRLPNGEYTEDPDEYGEVWVALGEKVEKLFPGYVATGYDPGIVLTRWETSSRTGYSRGVDNIDLSMMAIDTLLSGKEPEKTLRDDF